MRTTLVPASGGMPYVVSLPLTLVGSGPGCDWQVEGQDIPAYCCVLALADGLVLLRDLETGCIRVNAQPVRCAVLLHGTRLGLADQNFEVHCEPARS
jgi:hypothetical protein